jgi:hypothetical protein
MQRLTACALPHFFNPQYRARLSRLNEVAGTRWGQSRHTRFKEELAMHGWIRRYVAAATITAAAVACTAALAQAEGKVAVTLAAQRVTTQTGGKETLAPADQAKPGDVIEYRATYHNSGASSVRELAATLPIPIGSEYIARSASPAPSLASLDGRTFSPLPLKRRVHLADGRDVMQDVPISEYRSLRWALGTLPAQGVRTVRARVRLEGGPVATSVQH